jgi:AraC family transcriptional regulator
VIKSVGAGQFIAWNGGCLFIGQHHRAIPVHSHHAIQLVVGTDGDHLLRGGEQEPWRSYSVAAIPSRQPHSLDVTGSTYGAVIFVEPETREGRAITQRFLQDGIAEVGDDEIRGIARAVFAAWLEERRDELLNRVQLLVSTLAAGTTPALVTDPRILKAIDYINQHLDAPITLEDIASHACLSPSRFRHLFAEQTSMGVRPYILWRRFLLIWDLIMQGRTLSETAHAAGFADAAHMSRTCMRTFGFAPSAMQLAMSLPDPRESPQRTTV